MDKKTQNNQTNYYIFIGFSLICLLYIFKAFLTPLILALVFSIVCSKVMNHIPVKSLNTKALIVSLLVAAGFVIPFSLLISFGANESLNFLKNITISEYLDSVKIYNNHFIKSVLSFFSVTQSDFDDLFTQTIISAKKNIILKAQNLVYEIPSMLFNFSIMVSAIYFMLVDGWRVRKIFYQNYLYSLDVGQVVVKTFTSTSWAVLLATLGSAIIQTTVVVIPTLFINFDNVLLVAFGIFIFSMIPILGTVPVIGLLVFYHLSLDQYGIAIMYVAIGFIIGFIDSILKVIILQKKVKINPFIALLSTFAGVHVFGIFGLILGPIIIITLLKLLIHSLKRKKIKHLSNEF